MLLSFSEGEEARKSFTTVQNLLSFLSSIFEIELQVLPLSCLVTPCAPPPSLFLLGIRRKTHGSNLSSHSSQKSPGVVCLRSNCLNPPPPHWVQAEMSITFVVEDGVVSSAISVLPMATFPSPVCSPVVWDWCTPRVWNDLLLCLYYHTQRSSPNKQRACPGIRRHSFYFQIYWFSTYASH